MQLMGFQWVLVTISQNPPKGGDTGCKLSPLNLAWNAFTFTGLIKHGGLNNPTTGRPYFVLVCFPTCGQPSAGPSAQRPSGPTGVPISERDNRVSRRLLTSDTGMEEIYDDVEDEDLKEALARSMLENVAGSSARPVDSGFQRPLPPIPTARTRSLTSSSPPSNRRHLNPPINLTRSPSPHEIIRPTFRTVDGWADAFRTTLNNTDVWRVHGRTTELTVRAMLAHISSFFGGPAYALENIRDMTFTVGGSYGVGVFKNTMTELMNLVFSDETVWTMIGDTYVIDVTPEGISLPTQLSIAFAYALLKPDGDQKVLEDITFLQLAAPQEAQILQHWPAQPAGFITDKDNINL
ncbi:hypothetical protein C8R43DRAFT_1118055 [Mycena crocata]|nr:hypothetical protein C8R43DRAFT_1118055 [Mycena crocata]